MPVGIMPYLGGFLEEAGIPFKSYNWRTFIQAKDPYEVKPEYKTAIETARAAYKNAGYPSTAHIMAIEANLDPKEVFEKTLLTFGGHIDPDLKRSIDEYSARSDASEKYYVDDSYFNNISEVENEAQGTK